MTSATQTTAQRQSRGTGDTARVAQAARDTIGPSAMNAATVTVHVPLAFQQHRGRKLLVASDGAGQEHLGSRRAPAHARDEVTAAVRALARAFRWRKLLETGAVATIQEIAVTENINPSYVSRVLRLTLLAPEIVEAVMSGPEGGAAPPFDSFMQPFPIGWSRQALLCY